MPFLMRTVKIDQINISAHQLFLAYNDYKKHPCLINHSTLMDCLDDFVDHFDTLEDFIRADIAKIKLRE